MMRKYTNTLITFLVLLIFITQPFGLISGMVPNQSDQSDLWDNSATLDNLQNQVGPDEVVNYPPTTNMGDVLFDNNNTYQQTWDPWKTKAAIHAVATTDDGDMMALASGYLYDDQVHLYRWNYQTNQYDLVWEIGGGIFQSDVLDIEFGDTNHNNLTELIAAGEDGRLYVFEQKHLYDPITNTENQFELVWKSPRMGRIFDVAVEDTDGDYKEDIIVGTGDTVRWYEYLNHSGYPFNTEHWIEFDESFSYQVPSHVTALAVADTNRNGLKEVVVGMRSGEIQLLENNGTVLDVNGNDYPIMRNNNYDSIWSSGISIQRQINDMSDGDLDGDGYREILVSAQGQGAYILDEIDGIFGTFRIQRDYDPWESDTAGAYPLDTYVDWILNSSSLVSVDGSIADFNVSDSSITYVDDPNVETEYWINGTYHPEPLNNTASSGMPEIYPYRTAAAQPKDGIYTRFTGTDRPAWAVFDWGRHEEAAGNGITTLYDMTIHAGHNAPTTDYFTLEISQDGGNWSMISTDDITRLSISGPDRFEVEVDTVLNEKGWDYYRYMRLNVSGDVMWVDAFETRYFNKPIYDVQSTAVGTMTLKGQSTPSTVGYLGTVDGSVLALFWNTTSNNYEVVWDSWVDERYKLSTNIFDLEIIKSKGNTFPAWIDEGDSTFTFDPRSNLLKNQDVFSYDVENFFNYRQENNLEFIFTNSSGRIMAFSQSSPNAEPNLDIGLSQFLFNTDVLGLGNTYVSQGVYPTVQSWMDSNTGSYFGVSVVSLDTKTPDPGTFDYTNKESGYFLFVSKWDGQLNATTRDPGDVDVSVWYLQNMPDLEDKFEGSCFFADRCSFFVPVFNNITESGTIESKTLANSEQSGQLNGVLSQSSWAPSVQGYDVFNRGQKDLIMANGKLSLLEMSRYVQPRYLDDTYYGVNNKIGDMQTIYQSGYFEEINENSKGRIWNKVEPVDFDNDGDMDLYVGFARSDVTNFGVDKPTYGFTYWENQGTAEDPIWVEQKKAVTNNDPESNFRVNYFADPVLTYEEHEFPDGFDQKLGFHPALRTNRPSRMFMFKPSDPDTNVLAGVIEQFTANYRPPTSMIAATYPEAKRLDINLQFDLGNPKAVNFGYHIVESWDNSEDLREWTLTMDTADIDQDGNNEVIVGDFNNNMFVFEHLTNNTFKRAYKSDDLNRTIETSESPYAYEQFDGISGTFYRTIFQHAKLLIADTDLNQNDLKEVILATDNMIFVFESYLTPGGHIRQDSLKLVQMIDMYDQLALAGMDQDDIQISALSISDDMNLDGRRELLVGVGAALLIYEIDVAGSNPFTTFVPRETFFGATGPLKGQYKLPGNYYLYPNLQINSIIVEDVDHSGYLDIIIAGVDNTNAAPVRDGFIHIFEANGLGFERTIDYKDEFFNITRFNPVNTMQTGDHDYDGLTELYVGHDTGIDVFEFPGPSLVVHQQTITSNPHYTLPTRSYDAFSAAPTGTNSFIGYMSKDYSENDIVDHDKDMVRVNSTTLAHVYIGRYDFFSDGVIDYGVMVEYSNDNGVTWQSPQLVANSTYYQEVYGNNFAAFESPSISINYQSIVVGWAMRFNYFFGAGGYSVFDIAISRNYLDQGWSPITFVGANIAPDFSLNRDIGLDLFSAHRSLSDEIGVAFMNGSQLVMGEYDIGTTTLYGIYSPEFADGDRNDTDFYIHSFDIAIVGDTNPSFFPYYQQNFSLVFSGFQYNESLTLDYDLFHVPFWMPANRDFNFTERPTRAFSSGYNAFYPSLMSELDTNRLLVTFIQPAAREYGGMYAIWSNDLGFSWEGPYDMTHPLAIDPLGINSPGTLVPMSSGSGNTYRLAEADTGITLTEFVPQFPVIALNNKGGYSMVYSAKVTLKIPADPSLGMCGGERKQSDRYNTLKSQGFGLDQQAAETQLRTPSQGLYVTCTAVEFSKVIRISAFANNLNFTQYTVDAVTDLALGDSDLDGREEILAASGKHAFLFEFKENGKTFLDHAQKWISPEYFYGVSDVAFADVNGNGFDDLLISSERGTVHSYELINLQVNTTDIEPPTYTERTELIPTTPAEPFIYIGEEFTKSSKFLLHEITGDNYDDVILIDENFIGVADTGRLVNEEAYEEPIWQITETDFGKYLDQYIIADVDGDGSDDIVVAYSKILIAFNLKTGLVIWKTTKLADNTFAGYIKQVDMVYGDFASSNSGSELAVTFTFSNVTTSGSAIWMFAGDSGKKFVGGYLSGYTGGIVGLADVDNEGHPNLVFSAYERTNKLHVNYYVWDYSLNQIGFHDGFLPPITDIHVGEFSKETAGEEIMFVMDIPAIGFYYWIDFSNYPVWTWIYAHNGTYFGLAPTYHAESPYSGSLLNGYVIDYNSDGYDDFVGQAQDGSLYSMAVRDTTDYENTDIHTYTDTSSVPYGEGSVLIGDYCGTNTFFTLLSATSIGCYDSLDFSSTPNVLVASSKVDLDIITDLVGGDLDGDGNSDDVLMVGRNGFVWIYNNDWDGLSGTADEYDFKLTHNTGRFLGGNLLWSVPLVGMTIAIPATIVYRRKVLH